MGKTYTKEDRKKFKDSYVFKRNRRNKYSEQPIEASNERQEKSSSNI